MSVEIGSVEGLKVAVLGAGLMGSKIGRLFARCGANVSFVDAHDDLALAAAADVRTSLGDELRGEVGALALVAAVAQADLVVEAVTERLEVKAAILREVAAVSDTVPIASNTSTFQPSELQELLTAPERLLVAHFFNPADVVPLVEVVPGPATSRSLVEDVVRLLRELGKRPVVLNQECPGFVANRLQAAVLREAFALVERGVVSIAGLDAIVRDSLGPRWATAGPFRTADLGGLDVFDALCDQLFPDLNESTAAPGLLKRLVAAGDLGAKTGAGLFDYEPGEAERLTSRLTAAFSKDDDSQVQAAVQVLEQRK